MGGFGPHSQCVEAFLEAVGAVRLLEPDAELDALTAEATAWLEARACEHHAALLPFLPSGQAPSESRVTTTRSMREAGRRWEGAWARFERTSAPPGFLGVAGALQSVLGALPGALYGRLWTSALEALTSSLAPDGAWVRCLGASPQGLQAPLAVAACHARWLAAFGEDSPGPSPWAPLWALWERGAWPMVLPEGAFLVYIPVLRGRSLVPEPGASEPSTARLRIPFEVFTGAFLPSLEQVGYGPAPGLAPPKGPKP